MPINEITKFDELTILLEENQNSGCKNSTEKDLYGIVTFLLILFLASKKIKETNEQWDNFAHELLHENRFFPDVTYLGEIYKILVQNPFILTPSNFLYRAREIVNHDLLSELNKWDIHTEDGFMDFKKVLQYIDSHRASNAWGFDEENSGAPPKECSMPGRANPHGIPYLYLAEGKETAIVEIRPFIESQVSVATFKPRRELKLADFHEKPNTTNDNEKLTDVVFTTISNIYSRLNSGLPEKYLPTQALSEYLKHQGFDGIRFRSSLHENGVNIVLFDTNSCNFITSEVYQVQGMQYSIQKTLPPQKKTLETLCDLLKGSQHPAAIPQKL